MSVSRRKFLRTGAVVSAALVLNPSTFVVGSDSITSNSAAKSNKAGFQLYSREMFEPYVGDTFRVRVGKQVIDLKLVALSNEKPASGKDRLHRLLLSAIRGCEATASSNTAYVEP